MNKEEWEYKIDSSSRASKHEGKVEVRRIGETLCWRLELDQVQVEYQWTWRKKIEFNSEVNGFTGIEKRIQWLIEREKKEKKKRGRWEIIIKETKR